MYLFSFALSRPLREQHFAGGLREANPNCHELIGYVFAESGLEWLVEFNWRLQQSARICGTTAGGFVSVFDPFFFVVLSASIKITRAALKEGLIEFDWRPQPARICAKCVGEGCFLHGFQCHRTVEQHRQAALHNFIKACGPENLPWTRSSRSCYGFRLRARCRSHLYFWIVCDLSSCFPDRNCGGCAAIFFLYNISGDLVVSHDPGAGPKHTSVLRLCLETTAVRLLPRWTCYCG